MTQKIDTYIVSHLDSRGRIPRHSPYSEMFRPVFGIDDQHRVDHVTYYYGFPWDPEVYQLARYITDPEETCHAPSVILLTGAGAQLAPA